MNFVLFFLKMQSLWAEIFADWILKKMLLKGKVQHWFLIRNTVTFISRNTDKNSLWKFHHNSCSCFGENNEKHFFMFKITFAGQQLFCNFNITMTSFLSDGSYVYRATPRTFQPLADGIIYGCRYFCRAADWVDRRVEHQRFCNNVYMSALFMHSACVRLYTSTVPNGLR